jgi:FixJ family two-component response regulator
MSSTHSIAVIDDDRSVAEATGCLIRSLGFGASVYTSAEQFLLSGDQQDASCIVLDVQMPGMSGFQLQSRLESGGCRIPIIFFTGYFDERIRQTALTNGAVDLLPKPVNARTLRDSIHAALRLNRKKS